MPSSKTFAIAIGASFVSESVTFPLDVIKTRLQLQGDASRTYECNNARKKYKNRGYFRTAAYIFKTDGVYKGFYRGISPALLRHCIYSGIRLPLYEIARDEIKRRKNVVDVQRKGSKIPAGLSLPEAIILAGSCGAIGQIAANPTDLLKVRMQSGEAQTIRQAYRHLPTIRSMWAGCTPNVSRAIMVNQGDLMTYDTLKNYILTHGYLEECSLLHFICSTSAGFMACCMSTPFDVAKTRIMNQPQGSGGGQYYGNNMFKLMRLVLVNEGFFALYKGFFAAWPRMFIWSQVFWHSNENIRKLLGMKPF